ncbi:hypothetical protein [Pseudomonas viridiflava]|uniref:hypothetical protein n=1 Tax=Pseudomonas syringae group TaxID=136849 RepID=UPI0013C34705|nr:hypothetical protein [Pseudomonas viridiflava]MCQ9391492.1 hypothetical protein [Pseudomonas viridiflava]QXG24468.1 hypothetical protein KTT56_22190 [Pseudomonas viridiflava]
MKDKKGLLGQREAGQCRKVKMARLNGRMYRAGNLPAADTDPFVAKKEAVKFTNTFNQMKKMRRLAAPARPAQLSPNWDAERPGMYVHAERGHDQVQMPTFTLIVPHAPRGNAAQDAPRPGYAPVRPA